MSVASMRIMVVLPAPFGPKSPNTSPSYDLKLTLSVAVMTGLLRFLILCCFLDSLKVFLRFETDKTSFIKFSFLYKLERLNQKPFADKRTAFEFYHHFPVAVA